MRTARYTYIELVTGEKELYDHNVDPLRAEQHRRDRVTELARRPARAAGRARELLRRDLPHRRPVTPRLRSGVRVDRDRRDALRGLGWSGRGAGGRAPSSWSWTSMTSSWSTTRWRSATCSRSWSSSGPELTLRTTTEPLAAVVVGRGACAKTSPGPNSSFGSFTVVEVSPAAVTSASAWASLSPTTAGTTTCSAVFLSFWVTAHATSPPTASTRMTIAATIQPVALRPLLLLGRRRPAAGSRAAERAPRPSASVSLPSSAGPAIGLAEPEQIRRHVGPAGVPAGRAPIEEALDDRVERGRDPGGGRRRRDRALRELALRDRDHVGAGERRRSGRSASYRIAPSA